ncbi:MAG: hypothetical protein KDD15_27765 [Lewinella sp.]|nr:hypothetical protein [Lewinella sp.]
MNQRAKSWNAVNDRRAVFLECYSLMTANMLQTINDGQFNDGAWAKQLLHRFADYYFEALDQYDREAAGCTAVWRFAHDCACKEQHHILQDLLLGINAHINYDLVLSLVELLEPEWPSLSEMDRQRRYEDHCRVNEVIAATIDTVQDTVIERHAPLMDLIDRIFGRLDERLLSALISRWREDVWHKTVSYLDAPVKEREVLRRELEQSTMQRARRLVFKPAVDSQ